MNFEVNGFSGSWTGLGMIGCRPVGIDHGSSSDSEEGGRTGVELARMERRACGRDIEGRTGSNERDWRISPKAYIIIQS